jgi:hypothetical protein
MNRRVRYGIGASSAGLLVAYYALPLFLAIISVGEICPYSPLGTNLCGTSSSQSSSPLVPRTSPDPVVCTEDGIRYSGTTAQGAEVCLTVSRDGRELVETGFSFVRASGCPYGAFGTVHSNVPAHIDPSGHVENTDGLTATIRGDRASGVLESSGTCPGKKFKWTAHRAP